MTWRSLPTEGSAIWASKIIENFMVASSPRRADTPRQPVRPAESPSVDMTHRHMSSRHMRGYGDGDGGPVGDGVGRARPALLRPGAVGLRGAQVGRRVA